MDTGHDEAGFVRKLEEMIVRLSANHNPLPEEMAVRREFKELATQEARERWIGRLMEAAVDSSARRFMYKAVGRVLENAGLDAGRLIAPTTNSLRALTAIDCNRQKRPRSVLSPPCLCVRPSLRRLPARALPPPLDIPHWNWQHFPIGNISALNAVRSAKPRGRGRPARVSAMRLPAVLTEEGRKMLAGSLFVWACGAQWQR
ncbi:MAG: hypothetical protein IKQ55_12235 [Kiritimatiellae bacterium]|nr:hypothetical protein [Kiritimatiellia bacterium]